MFSKQLLLCFSFAMLSLPLGISSAAAQTAPPPNGFPIAQQNAPQPIYKKRFGVGYKIGNGLGFTGADIVVGLTDNFSIALQASYFADEDSDGTKITGSGFAPFVEYRFSDTGSTPYIAGGLVHARLSRDNVTGSASGGFGNIGWQWRWETGFAVHVGAGIGFLTSIKAEDGVNSIERSGGTYFNLESGLRYFFF